MSPIRLRFPTAQTARAALAAFAALAAPTLFTASPCYAAEPAAPAPAAATAAVPAPKPLPGVKHVLLVGIDGFAAFAWEKAELPNLKKLAARGALTLNARPVLPSVSAPNWASHLMGAGPEFHGFSTNDKIPNPTPLVKNERGIFPGIFPLVRTGYPTAKTAAFYDWSRIRDLIDYTTISVEKEFKHKPLNPKTEPAPKLIANYEDSTARTAAAAAKYIAKEKPIFSFVYLVALDEAGHVAGWDTPEYYATLAKVDANVGKLLAALDTAGIAKETVVIVVSDHGGLKKKHGGKTDVEMQTPWIIAGPGVAPGRVLKSAIVHFDTAPTIAHVLGLPPPQAWRGRPVLEAFGAAKH